MAKTIYVLNGPELNSLRPSELKKYEHSMLADVSCRFGVERIGACRHGTFVDDRRKGQELIFLHSNRATH